MSELKISTESKRDEAGFIPIKIKAGKFVCCCGYTLYKADKNTWRCEGGSHYYQLDQGDMVMDKFGNMSVRNPNSEAGKGEMDGKKVDINSDWEIAKQKSKPTRAY